MQYLLVCFNNYGGSYYNFDFISDVIMFIVRFRIKNYAIYKLYERKNRK